MQKFALGKSFGPVGSSAGLFIFIAALVIICFSPIGIILFVLGGFLGFSKSATRIDFSRKRIKFSNDVFGILPIGCWVSIVPGMHIECARSNKIWRSFSRGNRSLDVADTGYWLYLHGPDNKKVLPIMHTHDYQSAREARDTLSRQLGLTE